MNKRVINLLIASIVIMTMFSGCIIITNDTLLKLEWDDDNTYYTQNTITISNRSGADVKISLKFNATEKTEPAWDSGTLTTGVTIAASGDYVFTIPNPTSHIDQHLWIRAEATGSASKFVVGSHTFQANDGLSVTIF